MRGTRKEEGGRPIRPPLEQSLRRVDDHLTVLGAVGVRESSKVLM
jgi:hypothetical protein